MSPHLVLHELGIKFEAESVNLKTKQTASGKDFKAINPKGSVPTLLLDNKEVLTEGAVIVQYLADQKPEANLIPKAGTFERYRVQEWLNYIATELHKNFSPLFYDTTPAETKVAAREKLAARFDYVSNELNGKTYLMGNNYSVADAYMFTVLSWSAHVKVDLTKWPTILGYLEKIKSRPATLATLKAEGLLK
ncbi:MAG: glutathione S-transferase [Bacteriovoracaceae bacterium]|nr:glutathione S-transferase [Bacteriovoracaceae bacterium]